MEARELVDRSEYEVNGEVWLGCVEDDFTVGAADSDRRCVILSLRAKNGSSTDGARRLRLWLSHALLNDPTKNYSERVEQSVRGWLAGPDESGDLTLL